MAALPLLPRNHDKSALPHDSSRMPSDGYHIVIPATDHQDDHLRR